MIAYEEEVCTYLRIPRIPLKRWDGIEPFKRGVAVVEMSTGERAYAVVTFDERLGKVREVKVFTITPFVLTDEVYVVPPYMDIMDVGDTDLDDQSKNRLAALMEEAKSIEGDASVSDSPYEGLSEWVFDEIKDKEQAVAWLTAYRRKHKIKGKIPTSDDTVKNALLAIYANERGNTPKRNKK